MISYKPMKTKHVKRFFGVLILMVCLMATTSCSDDKSLPELIFDSETLLVSGQGEEAVLTYQALSWPQGAELSVSCDQEWLHDFDSSTPGELRFIVDPAPYAETKGRQAVLTLTSPSVAALHATVNVKQEYNSSFAYFQIDQVEDDRVAFQLFTNADVYNNFGYILHYCFTREEADAIQTGDQFFEAFDKKMEELSNGEDFYWDWRLGYMSSRSQSDMFCDLKPDTEYCLMAVGVTLDENRYYVPASPIQRTYFTTEPARDHPLAPATLTAKMVNGIGHIELQTTCEAPYIIIAVPTKSNYKKNSAKYDARIRNFASEAVVHGYLIHTEKEEFTLAGYNTIYYGNGTHYYFNAFADRDLVIVAQAYDERLRPLTDMQVFECDTYGIPSDCCATSIEMLDLEPWYVRFRAQSSDPSMVLYYGVFPKQTVDSLIAAGNLSGWADYDLYRRNGAHEFGFHDNLSFLLYESIVPQPGQEYSAFAYSSGGRQMTSPLARIDFTLPAEQPSSVKADVQEVKYFSIAELLKRYDLPMLEGSAMKYLVTMKFNTPDDVEHIDDYLFEEDQLNSMKDDYQLSDARPLLIALARQMRTDDDLYRYWLERNDGGQTLFFVPYEKGTHQVGEITKVPVAFTPEGCAPVEEFKEHYQQFRLKEKAVTLRSVDRTRLRSALRAADGSNLRSGQPLFRPLESGE